MKINSKTQYNRDAYAMLNEYHKGDAVIVIKLEDAIERAKRTANIKVYIDDTEEFVEMEINGKHASVFQLDLYYERVCVKDLYVREIDYDDEFCPILLSDSTHGNRIWVHPIFLLNKL